MSVIITPPNLNLKRKAKVRGNSGAGIGMEEAVAAGDAAVAERLGEARSELERLVGRLVELRSRLCPVENDHDELLMTIRQIADMAGTFGFLAVTEVGRSLEGYLLALQGRSVIPDMASVVLHTESIASLLRRDARGGVGAAEGQLLEGLRKVVEMALTRAGISRSGDAPKVQG